MLVDYGKIRWTTLGDGGRLLGEEDRWIVMVLGSWEGEEKEGGRPRRGERERERPERGLYHLPCSTVSVSGSNRAPCFSKSISKVS